MFELSWSQDKVQVRVNLKIVGTTRPAAAPQPSGTGFRRMRLPELVTAPAPSAPAGTPPSAVAAATPAVPAAAGGRP